MAPTSTSEEEADPSLNGTKTVDHFGLAVIFETTHALFDQSKGNRVTYIGQHTIRSIEPKRAFSQTGSDTQFQMRSENIDPYANGESGIESPFPEQRGAGGGIRTHEPLRDSRLRAAPLATFTP